MKIKKNNILFIKLNKSSIKRVNYHHSYSTSSFSSNYLLDSLITTGTDIAGIFPISHTIYAK